MSSIGSSTANTIRFRFQISTANVKNMGNSYTLYDSGASGCFISENRYQNLISQDKNIPIRYLGPVEIQTAGTLHTVEQVQVYLTIVKPMVSTPIVSGLMASFHHNVHVPAVLD